MQTTRALLAAVKQRHGLATDYQLAKFLGISRQNVSNGMHGATMSDKTAALVAAALDLPCEHVMALVAAERTKDETIRRAWQRAAAATAAVLAVVAVQIALSGMGDSALNFVAAAGAASFDSSIHYALALAILAAACLWRTLARRRLACLAAVLPLLFGCATPRSPWDRTDAALAGAAVTATVIDWGQTRYIAAKPCPNAGGGADCTDPYRETGLARYVIGERPTVGQVDAYFAGALIVGGAIAHALPSDWRKGFLGSVTVMELHVTNNNKRIGIGVKF